MTFDEKTLNAIIDCFVSVYGEKHRKIIAEKINNCLILLCGYKSSEERKVIKNRINQKYLIIFTEKIKKIINLSYKESIFLFGDNLFESNDMIGVFSSTSQKIMDMEAKSRAAQSNKRQILQTRNEFYSLFSKTISPDIADKLIKLYDETINQAKKEFFNEAINYEENKTKLDNYAFLEKPLFNRNFYDFENQQHNGVQPNFIKDQNGNIKLFPIINFSIVKNSMANIFGSPDYFDVLLIHEINHIIGMHLLSYENSDNYTIQMGLIESCKGDNKTKYHYMDYIDEVFNQSVAKKVTKLLHSKGIYLIDDPNKSQIEDSSLYEMGEFLLKGFFELFYNDILELYNSPGGLDKFYSKIDVTELTFLGKLLHEYLKRSNILDIKDSENLEYEKRAKEIMDRIKHNSKKDKIYEVVSLLDLNDLNDITPEKIKFAYEETLNIFNELDNLELKNKIHFVLLESLKYALENIEEIKSIQGITTNKTNAEMYGIQKIEIFKTLNKKNPLILNTIVTNLEASGISVNNIIKTIHSLEYGLVIPGVMRKLIELFGENTYLTLMKFNETEQNDYETRETLCSQLENSIVSILNSQIRK